MNADLLASYPRLVTAIDSEDYRRREGLEFYKAKLILADGSNLRVSEVWLDGILSKYAYYWLDENDTVIVGWDNAPHHPGVESHPHHAHQGTRIHGSEVRSLRDVLDYLNGEIAV